MLIDDGHYVTWQCLRPNVRVAVVGVPKTIDNDTTFGFDTTVEEAQKAINMACIEVLMRSAKHRSGWRPKNLQTPSKNLTIMENTACTLMAVMRLSMKDDILVDTHQANGCLVQAKSAYNGLGIVKLIGQQSSFIAMHVCISCKWSGGCLLDSRGKTHYPGYT